MTNRFLTLTLANLVLFGANGLVAAQNPLRPNVEPAVVGQTTRTVHSTGATNSINPPDATPEVYAAINNLDLSEVLSTKADRARNSASPQPSLVDDQTPKPIVDPDVAPAVHLSQPKNDMAPFIQLLDSLPNRLPAEQAQQIPSSVRPRQPEPDRATRPLNVSPSPPSLPPPSAEVDDRDDDTSTTAPAASKQFDRERLQALIKQLAINTGLVMCIGIGFILVAKQYFKAKTPGNKKKAHSPIQIQSTLKLSPKSSLHLIEAGEHRLIVATDQNGIKSMVRLTDSFANTLGSLEELTDEFTDGSGEPNQTPESNDAGAYSLATLGLSRIHVDPEPRASSNPPGARNRDGDDSSRLAQKRTTRQRAEPGSRDQDNIRRQMEAALSENGLKELILETLRKEQPTH